MLSCSVFDMGLNARTVKKTLYRVITLQTNEKRNELTKLSVGSLLILFLVVLYLSFDSQHCCCCISHIIIKKSDRLHSVFGVVVVLSSLLVCVMFLFVTVACRVTATSVLTLLVV